MEVRVVEHLSRGKLGDTCYGWERREVHVQMYAVNALIGISPLLLTIGGTYSINQVILLLLHVSMMLLRKMTCWETDRYCVETIM